MNKIAILLIEDNEDIRESTAEILELANYHVYKAINGKNGVELAKTYIPDLVLCDIMMPELDGYGVLHMLGKDQATANIPFIFLTAKTEKVDLRKGMEMGADDYLTKPYNDLELMNAIETRLRKKDREKTFYSQTLEKLDFLLNNEGLKELDKVIAERKIRHVQKKQVIYYEGDSANGIYLVLSGSVKTIKIASDGREFTSGMYVKDEFFGVAALLANHVYQETAGALSDVSICLLSKDILDKLLSKYPDVAATFIKILANNVLEKEEQLLQLAYYSVRKRMAEILLRLDGKSKSINISRDNLASLAGMATETVSRVLSDFIAEKLIEKSGTMILVLNNQRLQQMKN